MPVDRGEDAAFDAETVEIGTGEDARRVLGVFADEGYAFCCVVNIHPFYEQGRFNRHNKYARTASFVNRKEYNIPVIETGAGHRVAADVDGADAVAAVRGYERGGNLYFGAFGVVVYFDAPAGGGFLAD